MESKETAMSTSSILPLHIKSSKQSLSHAASEEPSNFDSSSLQSDRSQDDENASDPERPDSSLTTDSESEANPTISLLPSEPTTPINSLLSLSETPYRLLAAHHPTTGRVYKIQALPGKGVGMLATALIPTGTRLLAETPIMTVQRRDWQYDRTQRNAVVSAYLSLPHPYMQLFDALHHAPSQFQDWHGLIETEYNDAAPFGPEDPPPDVPFDGVLSRIEQSRVMAVFSTNAFGVCPSSSSTNVAAVICAEASRLNHSCTPNIQFTWNENVLGGAITMHALRDILPGEEITASYVDLLKSFSERKEKLRNGYGFDCDCVVCSANDEVIAASDARRHTIRESLFTCRTAREDEPWMRELSVEFRERLDSTVGLLKEEGLVNVILSNAHVCSLEMGIVPGDRVYLQQVLAVLKRCIGADHKWYLGMQAQLSHLEDAAASAFEAPTDQCEEGNASTHESAANPPTQAESSSADVVAESSAAAAAAAASTSSCAVGHSADAGAPAPEMASTANGEPASRTDAPGFPASDENDSSVESTDTDAADFDDIPCFDGACDDDDAAVPPRIRTGYTASARASSSASDSGRDDTLRRNLVVQKKEKGKNREIA
ncbi:uncharacterized protein J3D65DRAFT_174555 [Phyllosticta citribraziliensis]|uniref:SET domain-containing protein n=1 Tax=Phyllosticta citribraziliensis TaxID=989973 RepID=A0ABR1L758_9PEZI